MTKKTFVGLSMTVVFLATLFILPAHAKIKGEGLTVSPPIREVTLQKGQVTKGVVKLTNPTAKTITVYPLAMNFGAEGEGGEPRFFPATDEQQTYSLAKWIKFSQTKIALTSEQVVEFNYQIDVPSDAEPGGHYGVIFFATKAPTIEEQTNQVALSGMVGALILGTVPGKITEKASVEEFSTRKIYFSLPATFVVRLRNSGNIHYKPSGDIAIKDITGGEVKRVVLNQAAGNVLPASIRKFEEKWEDDNKSVFGYVGPFKANLRVVYGTKGYTLDGKLSFWVIPWWLIVAVGIIILVTIYFIIRHNIKKKKQLAAVKK